MRAFIDQDNCIYCGLCASTCPQVFRMTEDGPSEVYTNPVPPELEDLVVTAEGGCPAAVISLER